VNARTAILTAAAILGAPLARAGEAEDIRQACAVLTVAESKRLIGKGVARLPIVKKALADGQVIITTGTTNTYVAEEILGEKIEPGRFVTGRTYPAKNAKRLNPEGKFIPVIVLRKGKWEKDVTLDAALKALKAGDVVIKGGNMLDYENRLAGVLIGHKTSGTTGKIMPYIVARKAHLVIPIGLEKQCPGDGREIVRMMREPVATEGRMPSMFPVTGTIVTEIEALETLCGVKAFQAAAGGIGGAEGSRWMVFRGRKAQVEEARELIKDIQGEPPFVK
jgi:hypothetical protein